MAEQWSRISAVEGRMSGVAVREGGWVVRFDSVVGIADGTSWRLVREEGKHPYIEIGDARFDFPPTGESREYPNGLVIEWGEVEHG